MEEARLSYTIEYKDEAPEQVGAPVVPALPAHQDAALPQRAAFHLPPLFQTLLAAALVAAGFFSAEKFAPRDWRPSHLIGQYEAEVASQVEGEVAAAKLEQQAVFDAWVEQVRLVNAQNLEQYRAVAGSVAAYYQASYDRSRVYAEATARMQAELVQARIATAGQMRAPEIGMSNLARLFGLGMNALEPGSGESFMRYSDALSDQVYSELDYAASSGRAISVDGWNTGLPSPLEVQSAIARLAPQPMPVPPVFTGRAAPSSE
ncbi:MAG: hypothetical protein GC187_13305 [Alphaproteobacteria bacterium]|nr:hypothetical protein [Alphaproteobacteria bacterium]